MFFSIHLHVLNVCQPVNDRGSSARTFARSLAAQLVLAVDYAHSQGIVHGDRHLGNVLLKASSSLDLLSPEKLYEKYGTPEKEPIVRFDSTPLPPGVPTHGIVPIWLAKASEKNNSLRSQNLAYKFGEAFSPLNEQKYQSCTALGIRPPEVRFELDEPLSFSSDIWTLACTIWNIMAQRPLFESFFATEDYMTCEHVDTLGILPLEWWRRWEARRPKFTEDGKPINREIYRSWDDRSQDSVDEPRHHEGLSSFQCFPSDQMTALLPS